MQCLLLGTFIKRLSFLVYFSLRQVTWKSTYTHILEILICLYTTSYQFTQKIQQMTYYALRFTVQLDICKCKLDDKISNNPSDLITMRKTNTIGRWAGRISMSVGEQTKRKRCKSMTSPKPSGPTYFYFPSHINAEKASLFPLSVCCCLCWWKHSFLLERAWRSDL